MNLLIIGNGAAGISAAEAARSLNQEVNIKIITAEGVEAYYRPILSDYLSQEIEDKKFYLKTKEWYEQKRIEVIYNKKVEKIDSTKKEIILSDGLKEKYDKLIITSGSRASVPPILGVEKEGVFTFRTKEDADRIKSYAKKSKNAVVVGGGVLGLEAAWELKSLGLNVTVVEMESRIFPKQLDETGSKLVEEVVHNSGIKVYKNHSVKKIMGTNKVEAVEIDSGKKIEADMVLLSVGIKSNIDLAKNIGIKCNLGIIVNDKMETSHSDIHAAGDSAEHDGLVIGLWVTAIKQGGVAGANAVSGDKIFKQSIQPVTFKGMGMRIFSIGDIGHDPDNEYQIALYNDTKENIYKKLYFFDNKFVGGILIGDISKATELLSAARLSSPMDELVKKVF
jgi:NAD(P)H-nitrite reductase large subunit